jgi:methylenetetrahydrofolate reductase (NADPH)|tara:strand:- start:50 stop:838 length:789 start_codon:yes stop_codon:yes gene_type:complete
MSKYSLEIIPKQIERIEILPKDKFQDIYVAFIPGDDYKNIILASKTLIDKGYNPVPHIPSRSILDEIQLNDFLLGLNNVGVKKILAIGGSPKNKIGIFDKTMDIFNTGILNNFDFNHINIAGHPEGNPDDSDSEKNLYEKCHWLNENNYKSTIVTQWTLNIEMTNNWIKKIKTFTEANYKNNFDISIGIAGPAKLSTLINYAKICGVSATSLIIKNKKFGLAKLLKHNPSEIISNLTKYDNVHFFPFGGINELSKWLELKKE